METHKSESPLQADNDFHSQSMAPFPPLQKQEDHLNITPRLPGKPNLQNVTQHPDNEEHRRTKELFMT